MSRKIKFICDGCDAVEQREDTRTTQAGMPTGWSRVTVQLSGTSATLAPSQDGGRMYDLCGGCQRHLVEWADPTRWVRAAIEDAA